MGGNVCAPKLGACAAVAGATGGFSSGGSGEAATLPASGGRAVPTSGAERGRATPRGSPLRGLVGVSSGGALSGAPPRSIPRTSSAENCAAAASSRCNTEPRSRSLSSMSCLSVLFEAMRAAIRTGMTRPCAPVRVCSPPWSLQRDADGAASVGRLEPGVRVSSRGALGSGQRIVFFAVIVSRSGPKRDWSPRSEATCQTQRADGEDCGCARQGTRHAASSAHYTSG